MGAEHSLLEEALQNPEVFGTWLIEDARNGDINHVHYRYDSTLALLRGVPAYRWVDALMRIDDEVISACGPGRAAA